MIRVHWGVLHGFGLGGSPVQLEGVRDDGQDAFLCRRTSCRAGGGGKREHASNAIPESRTRTECGDPEGNFSG
jgi:hypothetical protein